MPPARIRIADGVMIAAVGGPLASAGVELSLMELIARIIVALASAIVDRTFHE